MLKKLLWLIAVLALIFGLYTAVHYVIQNMQKKTVLTTGTQQNSATTTTTNTTTITTTAAPVGSTANLGLADVAKADVLTGNADYDAYFARTQYTPANYVAPKYDPFSNKYNPHPDYKELVDTVKHQADIPPEASFTTQTNHQGFADQNSATVGTEFRFNASGSVDKETNSENLQVRWNFGDDGGGNGNSSAPNTYFSLTKSARHIYDKVGDYNVTLEVLDGGGNVSKITTTIKIVNNTEPKAYFTYKPTGGTQGTIIAFDTSLSYDSQYQRNFLQYRFDWDGDGVWDTKFEQKTIWNHKFAKIGTNNVIMEAKDPEGATDQTHVEINIKENTPPVASFTVTNKDKTYIFDASGSSDNETRTDKLRFRWDFNYTGADDIIFDAGFSMAPKASGQYKIPGHKTVRLQVKDEDGVITEAFQDLDATAAAAQY